MRIRKIIRNVIGLGIMSLVLVGIAFSQEATTSVFKNSFSSEPSSETKEKKIDSKEIREKEERALNLARQALGHTDYYQSRKTEVSTRTREVDNMVERKKYLTTTIQRLQIGLRRKKAKYARNPELLKVSVRQYSQDIEDMQYELAEIEKQLPALESKLERVTIKVEAEELKRGINKNKKEAGGFDEEFEEEVQKMFNKGKALILNTSLNTHMFR